MKRIFTTLFFAVALLTTTTASADVLFEYNFNDTNTWTSFSYDGGNSGQSYDSYSDDNFDSSTGLVALVGGAYVNAYSSWQNGTTLVNLGQEIGQVLCLSGSTSIINGLLKNSLGEGLDSITNACGSQFGNVIFYLNSDLTPTSSTAYNEEETDASKLVKVTVELNVWDAQSETAAISAILAANSSNNIVPSSANETANQTEVNVTDFQDSDGNYDPTKWMKYTFYGWSSGQLSARVKIANGRSTNWTIFIKSVTFETVDEVPSSYYATTDYTYYTVESEDNSEDNSEDYYLCYGYDSSTEAWNNEKELEFDSGIATVSFDSFSGEFKIKKVITYSDDTTEVEYYSYGTASDDMSYYGLRTGYEYTLSTGCANNVIGSSSTAETTKSNVQFKVYKYSSTNIGLMVTADVDWTLTYTNSSGTSCSETFSYNAYGDCWALVETTTVTTSTEFTITIDDTEYSAGGSLSYGQEYTLSSVSSAAATRSTSSGMTLSDVTTYAYAVFNVRASDASDGYTLTVVGTNSKDTTGITDLATDDRSVVSERYYNLSGVQVAEPVDGLRNIYIVVRSYDDGTTDAVKVIR